MESDYPKLNIFASRCLGFARCRWNDDIIPDKFIEKLKPYADFTTTCPEVEIGLGVPRDPIRIITQKDTCRLVQLNTGRDITVDMERFAKEYTGSLKDIDGFILKDRSPSCGIKNVKTYTGLKHSPSQKKTGGLFAREALKRFPNTGVETEARLSNFTIRENFLTKLFTFASFRNIRSKPSMGRLVKFHSENKFLLMAYSQKDLMIMGRLVANKDKKRAEAVFNEYQMSLYRAMNKAPKFTANINVMMHALGFFSNKLSAGEKRFFLNSLEEYRREQAPLSVPLNLLQEFIIRFEEDYLSKQTFFRPYPRELLKTTDSGKGRDL